MNNTANAHQPGGSAKPPRLSTADRLEAGRQRLQLLDRLMAETHPAILETLYAQFCQLSKLAGLPAPALHEIVSARLSKPTQPNRERF